MPNDDAVEKMIADSERALLPFAKLIMERMPNEVKAVMDKVFSPDELREFADRRCCGVPSQELMRYAREELKHLLDGGWAECRAALAVSELVLAVSTVLACHSGRSTKERTVGLLNKKGLDLTQNPRPQGGATPVPVKYFISRIAQYAFLSPENANLVWEAMIDILIEGKADLLEGVDISHPSPDSIEIKLKY